MPISPFLAVINQLADERGVSKEVVLETVEAAVAAAYRKDYGQPQDIIRASIDPETGQFQVFQVFDVVKAVKEPEHEKTLSEAKKLKKDAKLGGQVEIKLESKIDFGRIAAQTAKQVLSQRMREAEREIIIKEYKSKEGQVVAGIVQQIEGPNVLVDIGKTTGFLPASEQIPGERLTVGQRIKIYLKSVEDQPRGPRIVVSRADAGLISGLFRQEVPEVLAGTVEIKGLAREASTRSKVAVAAIQEGLDPVGSCVGQRGTRIATVLREIGEEKIDIVLWDPELKVFIRNALAPATVEKIELHPKAKRATVYVNEDQLALAIGKGGQNVRLASKITGYAIDLLKWTPALATKKVTKKKPLRKTTPVKTKVTVASKSQAARWRRRKRMK